MSQHPELALSLAALVGLSAEGGAEPPLVPAERGLDRPSLVLCLTKLTPRLALRFYCVPGTRDNDLRFSGRV